MRRRATEKPGGAPVRKPASGEMQIFTEEDDPPVPPDKDPEPWEQGETSRIIAEADREKQRREEKDRAREDEAPKKAVGLAMGGGFDRIITHKFQPTDHYEEYMTLRTSLSFKGVDGRSRASSMGYGELVDALDLAEDAAYRASELFVDAKVANDAFEFDAKVIMGALRKTALDELTERKAKLKASSGTSGKVISNDDIEAEIASQNPDEFAELETRRGKARRMVQLFEELAVRLSERAKDLRAMVSKSRAVE